MARITVFYNDSFMARVRGLKPGDFLSKIWEFETHDQDESDAHILTLVFKIFNGSGNLPTRTRSMSVGDVVDIDGQSYTCEDIGWRKLLVTVQHGIYARIAAAHMAAVKPWQGGDDAA